MSGRSCSAGWAVFFTRDGVPPEEALQRAEAEDQSLLPQHLPNLLDRAIRLRAERFHDGVLVGVDATRLAVAAERLRSHVALLALQRLPQRLTLAALTPKRSASRCVAPARTAAIARSRRSTDRAFDMSAGLHPGRQLESPSQ